MPAHKSIKLPAVGCRTAGAIVNVIGPVPPDPLTLNVPSQPGVQLGCVLAVIFTTTAVGSLIVTVVVDVQRLLSVTVIV